MRKKVTAFSFDFIVDKKGPHGISYASWLEREKLALLVVDVQNYITQKKYSGVWTTDGKDEYYYSRLNDVVLPNIKKLIERFRSLKLRSFLFESIRLVIQDSELDVALGQELSKFRQTGMLGSKMGKEILGFPVRHLRLLGRGTVSFQIAESQKQVASCALPIQIAGTEALFVLVFLVKTVQYF